MRRILKGLLGCQKSLLYLSKIIFKGFRLASSFQLRTDDISDRFISAIFGKQGQINYPDKLIECIKNRI